MRHTRPGSWTWILLLALAPALIGERLRLEAAEPKPVEQVAAPKDVGELRSLETQVKSVVAKALPCVVALQIGSSQGSGVVVSRDGLVMTAGHVVAKPGLNILFRFSNGKTARGKTLGLHHGADAGLAKITDRGEWPCVEKGRSAGLKPGGWCVTIGHPLGYRTDRPPVVRIGRVLRLSPTVLQTDCPIVSGDSGGPVFDLDGRVIGINSRIGNTTDMNLHVPVDVFHDHWEQLVKGQSFREPLPGRDSDQVKAAFHQVVADVSRCVVRVKCDGQDAALGTIVGPDGWIVSKASEMRGKIICRMSDGRELEARVTGTSQTFDLAMLKVEASGLPAIPWVSQDPAVGQWVATAGQGQSPLAVGIISVPRRRIPAVSGSIGVMLVDAEGGARIESLLPDAPAEKAGIKPKDIVTHVDGKPVKNRQEMVAAVKQHRLGEAVKLAVRRGDKTHEFSVALAKVSTPGTQRRDLQNQMGVGVSKRADDFPKVLQHDTVLRPTDCGGPLVDLSGKVIGVNIAHAGRTETYCVPSDVLLPLMYELMSGRMARADAKPPAEKPHAAAKPAEKPPEAKPAEKPPMEKPAEKPADKPAADKPPAPKPAEQPPAAKPAEKPVEKSPK